MNDYVVVRCVILGKARIATISHPKNSFNNSTTYIRATHGKIQQKAPQVPRGDWIALAGDGVEIFSDDETTGLPPYIYNVTQNVTDDGKLILEVINLREDGSIEGDAPYGDFIVLRAGLHLYYAKK